MCVKTSLFFFTFYHRISAFICALMASVSNISLYIRRFTHLEEMALVIPGLEKRTGYDPVNLIEMDVLNNHRYRSDVML